MNWLIRRLGGYTADDVEDMRYTHEKWAVKYLMGKNGEVRPDAMHYHPYRGDTIIILESETTLKGGVVDDVLVAPWVKNHLITDIKKLRERA